MKYRMHHLGRSFNSVAPFTGAWIEIRIKILLMYSRKVAPFTGAWIEIQTIPQETGDGDTVAPFTGAWIEIRCRF